jgi:hypothetical protein
MNLDAKLAALFSGLDTRADFNARLLERLHREIAEEAQRAEEALRLEQLRHRVATRELRSSRQWKQAFGRYVNLETVGIGTLAGLLITTTWSADQIRQVIPAVATALGLLLAVAPVLLPLLRRR